METHKNFSKLIGKQILNLSQTNFNPKKKKKQIFNLCKRKVLLTWFVFKCRNIVGSLYPDAKITFVHHCFFDPIKPILDQAPSRL